MMKRSRNTTPRLHGSVLLAAAAALLVVSGCAYYNMLYNAKKAYGIAEAMPDQPDGTVSRQQVDAYQKAIDKAQAMIEKYPHSRHVDDAYLLIARSQYARREYAAAIGTVDTLLTKLPDTD